MSTRYGGHVIRIFRAAEALLRPLEPVPIETKEVQERLTASWAILPQSDLESSVVGMEVDKRDARESVGSRCLGLLIELQSVLVKEFWPSKDQGGLQAKDFILGTNDLRLLRLLVTCVRDQLLLPLVSTYLTHLLEKLKDEERIERISRKLKTALLPILHLLHPPPHPPSAIDQASSSVAGPSSGSSGFGGGERNTVPLPPTVITQTMIDQGLPHIYLSTILLAYTPTFPPAVHRDLRSLFISTLDTLDPAQNLSSLRTAQSLGSIPSSSQSKTTLWFNAYPLYVSQMCAKQMSSQIRRPGGVRGLMANVFGERGDDIGTSMDEKKVESVVRLLTSLPGEATEAEYVTYIVSECLAVLHRRDIPRSTPAEIEVKGKGEPRKSEAPRAYKAAAIGTIFQFALATRSTVGRQVLERIITDPWRVPVQAGDEEKGHDQLHALRVLDNLLALGDPAVLPRFIQTYVDPIAASIFRFYASSFRGTTIGASATSSTNGQQISSENAADIAAEVISVWAKYSSQADIARLLNAESLFGSEHTSRDEAMELEAALEELQLSISPSANTTAHSGVTSGATTACGNASWTDRLVKIENDLGSSDIPVRAEAISLLTDVLARPDRPPNWALIVTPALLRGIEDPEDSVHSRAIPAYIDTAAQDESRTLLNGVLNEYGERLKRLERTESLQRNEREESVMRLGEVIVRILSAPAYVDRDRDDISQLLAQLGRITDSSSVTELLRKSAQAVCDTLRDRITNSQSS